MGLPRSSSFERISTNYSKGIKINQVTVIQNGPVKVIEEVFKKKTVITFEIQSEVSVKTIEIQDGRIEYTLNKSTSESSILRRIVNANLSNGVDF